MKNGVTILAIALIASFAIDRLVTGLLFLLSFSPAWNRRFPDPALTADAASRAAAEKRQKLMYYVFAAMIAIAFLAGYHGDLLLRGLGITVGAWLDRLFTILVLVGGSERIAELLGSPAATKAARSEAPIRVTGTLTLEDRSGRGAGSGTP